MLTNPPGVILRIILLSVSATYKLPEASTAIADGAKKLAAIPCPSLLPDAPDPARVVTKPPLVILRITSLPKSVIYKFPEPSIAIPVGKSKQADIPCPFVFIAVPAIVLTKPPDVIFRISLF